MSRLLRAVGFVCLVWGLGAQAAASRFAMQSLNALQDTAKKKHWHFTMSYNPMMELKLSDITGLRVPKDWSDGKTFYTPNKLRLPAKFDWRDEAGGLTPIKNQGQCGSCWAFGTTAAFENALKIRDHILKPLSEQQLVDCDDNSYGCSGGFFAHHLQVNPGQATSEEYPYQAYDGRCKQKNDYPDKIADWGYIGGKNRSPSVDEIKQAIYQYGVVAATVAATGSMQAYHSGVYDDCDGYQTNHIVALVGWNDDEGTWIMRNSWGERWGEKGYMRIKYNCSSIAEQATFVNYKAKCQPQPIAYAGEDRSVTRGASTRLGSMPVEGQTYHWTPEAGLDNPSSAMPLATAYSSTVYTVKVTSSCGTAEQSVRVTVN